MKLPSHFASWKEKGGFFKSFIGYIKKLYLSQKNDFPLRYMASIAIVVGGALISATAFVGGSYLAKYLSEDQNIVEEEKKRHDISVEKYQAASRSIKRDEQSFSIGLQLMTVSRHRKSIILLIWIRLLS